MAMLLPKREKANNKMKLIHFLMSANSQTVLYLLIVVANIDYVGILDYCIKAFLGSAIWFAFKVLAERYEIKSKKSKVEVDNIEPDNK